MKGVHTNYARNTKLNFKFNKTNSDYTEDSYYSQQKQNFGRWRWIASKDAFGDDIPGQITVFNWLKSEYNWQIVISYTPQKGLMITDDPNELGSTICNRSTITIKRMDGSVENIYSTYDNKTLYITGESMRKFFKIMDKGNFKMNITESGVCDRMQQIDSQAYIWHDGCCGVGGDKWIKFNLRLRFYATRLRVKVIVG